MQTDLGVEHDFRSAIYGKEREQATVVGYARAKQVFTTKQAMAMYENENVNR